MLNSMTLHLQLLAIIDTVSGAGLMMDRQTVHNNLTILRRPETVAEIDRALRDLEQSGHLVAVSNPDAPGGCRYRLTDSGLARLAAEGL